MAKFLSDDTLESNQWWEADSHLQKNLPLGSNQIRGHTLATDKTPLGSNQSGRARDIHTHYTHEEQQTHE